MGIEALFIGEIYAIKKLLNTKTGAVATKKNYPQQSIRFAQKIGLISISMGNKNNSNNEPPKKMTSKIHLEVTISLFIYNLTILLI